MERRACEAARQKHTSLILHKDTKKVKTKYNMAKIKDVLEIESHRESIEQCREINLFQEGTFYRAYEWSAWLCVRYVQEFKTTKRLFNNIDEGLVFVGFPVTSLQKFTPEGATVSLGDDKSAHLLLPSSVFQDVSDIEQLKNEFANWKQSVPLTENAKKEIEVEKYGTSGGHPTRLTEIMHHILAYPIEQKSPMECMSFLAEIKKRIADII